MNQYEIKFQPWDGSWCLSGPVGANGELLFQTARYAASHARWAARTEGGVIKVYDTDGQLFKTIETEADVSGGESYVLPSV
ncbi:MAG: hypothetical protein ACI9NQ_001884 [Paracoccaceae bacterium]|jgi:hypothetical protein